MSSAREGLLSGWLCLAVSAMTLLEHCETRSCPSFFLLTKDRRDLTAGLGNPGCFFTICVTDIHDKPWDKTVTSFRLNPYFPGDPRLIIASRFSG